MDLLKVLVLNQTFEPLHFCDAKRAVVLILSGKAENIEYDGRMVRSPSISIRLPIVIRLIRFIKRPYKKEIPFSKKNVFKRDQYRCQYCGKNHANLTIDHIIPKSKGGRTSWENVVVACQKCNLIKGNRPLDVTNLRLLKRPRRPSPYQVYYGFPLPFSTRCQQVWDRYLLCNKKSQSTATH